MEDKKKGGFLIVAGKVAYFPLALIACCQLALWASVGTDTFLLGDPARLSGGHFVLSAGLLFVLLPIWFVVFLILFVVAFFRLRRRNSAFGCLVAVLSALSVFFFLSVTESLPWS
ncbi:hypothetical protein GQ57_20180 [Burkholderia sp. MSh2]|uniref:Lipoprotein n=1 Tax=Burkholderia paludis TaxID=1506587 RepID=A0A6J5DYJ5_9BURK|nr:MULTISPECIES: hypothetical protein [Burkholderia]KEZ04248.1 hypothetical protein GQ57_20180 [Burkholderia sp. MSh2]CAB3759138.1 hypothetical protein LMG30113_03377 [Burkholderia paludis]VWB53348.1 hypothetical protein BPA30113_02319 [Burkholderia paludis]